MSSPMRSRSAFSDRHLPDDLALVHHRYAVGHHQELIEVLGDEQDAHTLCPLLAKELVDGLGGAYVQPGARVGGNHDSR